MKRLLFFIACIFSSAVVFSILFFIKEQDVYDLSIERTLASDVNFSPLSAWEYQITTLAPKNIWYLGIRKTSVADVDVCVTWGSGSTECLDREDEDNTDAYYTLPVETDPTRVMTFSLAPNVNPADVTVYSMNTLSAWKKLVWALPSTQAGNGVVSRAEWWADETLRYADSATQKSAYQSYLSYLARDKTQAEIDAINKQNAIDDMIIRAGGNMTTFTSIIRYENGHRLFWPIQKVKQVDRIILHHTNDTLKGTDEEMIRAIYAYHAVTRGWGDIGYNYIIGQRGKIYEWRAGGDYVVAAHAHNDNFGSVGIAVLGNYDALHLNADQLAGLKSAIMMVAQKYGITLTNTVVGWDSCSASTCTVPARVTTAALLGHEDVSNTDCPGANIYSLIPTLITELNRPYTPVLNPVIWPIDPLPSDQSMNMKLKNPASTPPPPTTPSPTILRVPTLTPTPIASTLLASNSPSPQLTKFLPAVYFGQKFRARLSYPTDRTSITLSSLGGTSAIAFLDSQKISVPAPSTAEVSLMGTGLFVKMGALTYIVSDFSYAAPVVSIDSWTRVPDWDTSGRYNDNLFRDTIEVYNQSGTLIVINHLPLEYYLKWLGEVSNTDFAEKIKTIIVAARTYAAYYMDSTHRKYGTNRYDGSDDPDSFQKYLGYSYELRSPNVAALVDATRGEKISYHGVLIKPWYFSVSNGRTLSYLQYCAKNNISGCQDIPYLQSVDDPAGKGQTQSWHGVGISWIGATYFATQGWDYKKIITYYMSGVTVGK